MTDHSDTPHPSKVNPDWEYLQKRFMDEWWWVEARLGNKRYDQELMQRKRNYLTYLFNLMLFDGDPR